MSTLPLPAWAAVAPMPQIAHAATASVALVIAFMCSPSPVVPTPALTVGREPHPRDTSYEGTCSSAARDPAATVSNDLVDSLMRVRAPAARRKANEQTTVSVIGNDERAEEEVVATDTPFRSPISPDARAGRGDGQRRTRRRTGREDLWIDRDQCPFRTSGAPVCERSDRGTRHTGHRRDRARADLQAGKTSESAHYRHRRPCAALRVPLTPDQPPAGPCVQPGGSGTRVDRR